jgi:hypothetical protein
MGHCGCCLIFPKLLASYNLIQEYLKGRANTS